jgi:hypothetical protein
MTTKVRPLEERVFEKIDVGDCWNWTASTDGKGYGQVALGRNGGKQRLGRAHRVVYELLVGPIPEGLTLDHLCKNIICVNPDHLEPVTMGENVRRAEPGRWRKNYWAWKEARNA